jgi:DeoR/GlpR family transcriptional regulator of sugar metabolism
VRADAFFMGVTGIHPEAGLTTGDSEEAAIKRALSRQAAETYVLASGEKLGAVSPFVVLPLGEIDALVVEPGTPEERLAPLRAAGAAIVTGR